MTLFNISRLDELKRCDCVQDGGGGDLVGKRFHCVVSIGMQQRSPSPLTQEADGSNTIKSFVIAQSAKGEHGISWHPV